MNEHQQLLDTLGAKNQTEAMQIIAQFHAAQIAGMRNVPYGWKVLPEDYSSHHTDWTKAVRIAIDAAAAEGSDTSYWKHQLQTLNDIRSETIAMYEFGAPATALNPEDLRFLGEALAGVVVTAVNRTEDRGSDAAPHTALERARWGALAKDLAPVLLAWQRVYAALGSPK